MKSLRRTFLGLLVLLLAGAAVGCVYAYYFWTKSDEWLVETVREKLEEIAPGWNVTFGKARFDIQGRVHLHDVILPGDDPQSPILQVAELVLVIDRETLSDSNPSIQHIRIVRPRSNLVRDAGGTWNVEKLPALNLPKSVIPECHWEQGTVSIRLQGFAAAGEAATRRLEGLDIRMIPSARRQYLIKLTGNLAGADAIECEARWNIEDGSWSANGDLKSVLLDRPLLDLGAELSPEFRSAFDRFESSMEQLGGGRGTGEGGGDRRLQFDAAADIRCRVSKWQPDSAPEYQFALDFLRGRVSHPAIEYPFDELRGRVTLDNQQIEITELTTRSGPTHFRVSRGRITKDGDRRPADCDLEITRLPIDARLYRLLPEEKRRLHDSLDPAGEIDAQLHLEFNGDDRWEQDGVVTARDCSASHVKFPYRVEHINGTIEHNGETFDLVLEGRSGNRPVKLRGKIKSRGAQTVLAIDIETVGLPIDKKLRHACPPKFQALLDELGVDGELEGRVRLTRSGDDGAVVTPHISGSLKNGNLNYARFPYALTDVSGRFQGTLDRWTFKDFKGRHDLAQLSWSGRYGTDDDGTPRFDLEFDARSVACDQALLAALPAPVQAAWGEINPEGTLNVEQGMLHWSPGALPHISLKAELVDGKLTIRSFPYVLQEVYAQVDYNDGEVFLGSLTARHDDTRVEAAGKADFPEPGEWHLHLSDLKVDNLDAGSLAFRKTLPAGLRGIVNTFNPRGRLSISGTLDFRGKQGEEYPVTAAWDTVTVYTGTTITAGIELKDLYGQAAFRGTYDGEAVVGEGQINLNTVKVFQYTLTDVAGPVRIDATQLTLGTPDAERGNATRIDESQRLTAKFIGGQLELDAVVLQGEPMQYQARIALVNGDLRRYAQTYMKRNQRLEGTMNGKVELKGIGTDSRKLTGSGQLRISHAALYDLPLIVAIFNVLNLNQVGSSAFDQADFLFVIKDERVRFRLIDLVGNAIKMVGYGTVGFDGNVNLQFLSQIGRSTVPIPLVREAINELTKGLVGVRVRGPITDPQAEEQLLPQLDDALKRLWGNRDARGPTRR